MAISSALGSQALLPAGFGFRNVLINGNFQIWQRWVATSINVSAGTTAYTADRWFMSPVGATMGAVRNTNVPSGSPSRYSLEIAPNGVGGSTCKLGQRIEAANVYALKGIVTFSAWIFNNTTAQITPVLLLGTPSAADDFTTVTNMLTQTLQPCANGAWTKVSFTVDISGYSNINNGLQVEIQTSGHTTFGRIVRVADVQLEKSSISSSFENRPYGVELSLCQRYYWRNEITTLNARIGVGMVSGTACQGYMVHPVTMRTAPTAIGTSTTAGNFGFYNGATAIGAASVPTFDAGSPFGTNVAMTLASSLAANGGHLYRVNSPCWIEVSAEL